MEKSYSRDFASVRSLRMSAMLCLLIAAASVHAEPMTERAVTAAVETWLRGVITDARTDAGVDRMEPHVVDAETVAYIAHLRDGGYCLCGADDLVLPVYLYSPEGAYDPDIPSNEYILGEIATRLTGLRQSLNTRDPGLEPYEGALAERALYWRDLAARRVPARADEGRVLAEPDMMVIPFTARWGQGSPYNDQTPVMPGPPYEPPPNEGHSLVGCVATAMSEIMYYWKWPESGTGYRAIWWGYLFLDGWESTTLQNDPGINPAVWAGRLEWTDVFNPPVLRMNGYWDHSHTSTARGISPDPAYLAALDTLHSRAWAEIMMLEADFGATTYNWDLMEDVHTDGDGVDAGDAEVAKLCYQAGVAVGMNWGRYLSLAPTGDVDDVLVNHFRYDQDAIYGLRNVNSMTAEIQWLRPVQFRATDANGGGGHSWVVYGYDKATDPNRRFMMHMGWGGKGDGWYSCDSITPNTWEFNLEQRHVTRIAPRSVVGFVGSDYASSDGSPGAPYHNVADAAANAPDGATLIFKAGRDDTFAGGPLVIDRPFVLKGYDVTISRE